MRTARLLPPNKTDIPVEQSLRQHLPVKRKHRLRPVKRRKAFCARQREDAVFHVKQQDADAGQLRAGFRVEANPLARLRLVRRSLGPLAFDEQHIRNSGIMRAQLCKQQAAHPACLYAGSTAR